MEQLETRFKQVDVLPMVKHFMDELDLCNLFAKYVPAAADNLADHGESLCILTANIICENKPLYKVKDWLSKYADGLVEESVEASLFNDDRLARALSALFHADRHSDRHRTGRRCCQPAFLKGCGRYYSIVIVMGSQYGLDKYHANSVHTV